MRALKRERRLRQPLNQHLALFFTQYIIKHNRTSTSPRVQHFEERAGAGVDFRQPGVSGGGSGIVVRMLWVGGGVKFCADEIDEEFWVGFTAFYDTWWESADGEFLLGFGFCSEFVGCAGFGAAGDWDVVENSPVCKL